MAKSLHERATEVIAKVIDLNQSEASNRIDRECGQDDELKKAVMELFTEINSSQEKSKSENTNKQDQTSIKKSDTSTTLISMKSWSKKVFENKKTRLILLIVSLTVLLILGVGIRFQVRHLLVLNTSRHLEDQLHTQFLRMEEWLNSNRTTIQNIATDPQVIAIAQKCDSLELLDPSLDQLRDESLINQFRRQYKLSASFAKVPTGIISKEGARILASLYQFDQARSNITGIRLGTGVYDSYLKSMNQTVFVKPLSSSEIIYQIPDTSNAGVVCIFFSPILNSNGKLLGIAYNTYLANSEFSSIMSRVHFGKRGETYAFDREGRMLSAGRFTEKLRKIPFLNMAPNDETIYNIQLRDPGGDLMKAYKPKQDISQLPFVSPLQALFIKLNNEKIDSLLIGESNKAYTNYYGKQVISRWVWLPNYDFGMITEVQLSEALSTLKFFDAAFMVLYLLIFSLSYLLYKSNVKIFNFGKKIENFKQLGQYKLKQKIGEGGFGEVYLAEHAFLKTPVAIKLLKKEFNDTDLLNRFEKEVMASSSLAHPNTIKVFDYGTTDDGQFYYVMEYLNGLSLDKLIEKEPDINLGRVIYILLNTCLSLKEAHQNGLIHRDIKPMNIMLCNQGGAYDVVKVLDFGLVKSVDTDVAKQTQINRIGGTPMFMAPERIRDPFNTDQRVDIYSIGALGVFLFSGKYLLEIVSQKMLSGDKTIQGDFKTQLVERKDVPMELNTLLMQCLSFEPEKRPNSINIVIEQLEILSAQNPWTRSEAEIWWKSFDVYG